jgi:hypothetical protein
MRIIQLLSGVRTIINKKDRKFLEEHPGDVRLDSLDIYDNWTAQQLVRKGLYTTSEDGTTLIRLFDDSNPRKSI